MPDVDPAGEDDALVAKKHLHWKEDDIKMEYGAVVEMADGKISNYKLDEVLHNGFFKVKAPAFSHPYVAWQVFLVTCLVVIVGGICIVMHKTGFMVVDDGLVAQSSAIFGYFAGLSSFLFGFFVFDQLGVFVTVKNVYVGGYMASFSELMFLTSSWLDSNDPKTQLFKETVVRWGMATFALMCGNADPESSDEDDIKLCEARGLLTAEEAAVVRKANARTITPLLWMLDCYETNLAGLPGSDFKVHKAENKINGMRGAVGSVLNAVGNWGQTPLPLVHLMSALVKIQLILLSLSEGVHVAAIIVGDSQGKLPQILFVLLMVSCPPVIFQGLLEFVVEIGNPFGRDWVDFPVSLWYAGMRDEMLQYVAIGEAAKKLPAVKAAKKQ